MCALYVGQMLLRELNFSCQSKTAVVKFTATVIVCFDFKWWALIIFSETGAAVDATTEPSIGSVPEWSIWGWKWGKSEQEGLVCAMWHCEHSVLSISTHGKKYVDEAHFPSVRHDMKWWTNRSNRGQRNSAIPSIPPLIIGDHFTETSVA